MKTAIDLFYYLCINNKTDKQMTIQAQKIELVKMILDINDKNVLNNFIQIAKASKEDWWDTISEEEKIAIEKGLAQAERGELVAHDVVMKKVKAKYKL